MSQNPLPAIEQNNLKDRTIVVTGGTAGIGLATGKALARMGARVLIVGRDPDKGAAAVAAISSESGASRVEFLRADLASLAAVRALAVAVLGRCDRLDVLVNNAGVYVEKRATSVDGFEMHFAVNHLAPFLLTDLLLPRLRATPGARVVNVSSFAHRYASIDPDDLQSLRSFSPIQAYNRSKLANVMFTRQLAQRLGNGGPTVNAADPGPVRSDLNPRSGLLGLGTRLLRPFLRTPEEGARTTILLATSPELAGVTGQYFSNGRERTPSRHARNDAIAARLWELSAEMTGIAPGGSGV